MIHLKLLALIFLLSFIALMLGTLRVLYQKNKTNELLVEAALNGGDERAKVMLDRKSEKEDISFFVRD